MTEPKPSAGARETDESLSERIIQNWLAGVPGDKLQRLANAAPALLAACQTAVECCERKPHAQEYEHMYIELKAAIAKAEAQQ